jgi:hypothetical protein
MTRNGKIARLPREVREQLNRRLRDGQPGKRLVEWLNRLAEVKQVLADEFGGRAISEQNLSEWKQGGYQEWLRHEESRLRMDRLSEEAADLTGIGEGSGLSDQLSAVLTVELAGAFEALREESIPPAERWRRLREVLRDVAQLRREDHRAAWLRIGQERWNWDAGRLEREEADREIREMKHKLCAPFWGRTRVHVLTEIFGGGELGEKIAARVVEIEEALAPGTLSGEVQSNPVESKQTESSPAEEKQSKSRQTKPDADQSDSIKLDQGGSSPIKLDQASEPGGRGDD